MPKLPNKTAQPRSDTPEPEDTPTPRPRPRKDTSGWGHGDTVAAESSQFANNFKIKDGESKVIMFLGGKPYANHRVHWVKRAGRQSFICVEDDCPLCAVGIEAKAEHRFTILELTEDSPMLWTWNLGSGRYKEIKALADDPQRFSSRWYRIHRTGSKMNDTKYHFEQYRRVSDIKEDFPELYVPSADELAEFKPFTTDDVDYSTMEELDAIADESE